MWMIDDEIIELAYLSTVCDTEILKYYGTEVLKGSPRGCLRDPQKNRKKRKRFYKMYLIRLSKLNCDDDINSNNNINNYYYFNVELLYNILLLYFHYYQLLLLLLLTALE